MTCSNCGNKQLMLCTDPVDPINIGECAKVCDLWCPIDYFDYDDHYPAFQIINEPK